MARKSNKSNSKWTAEGEMRRAEQMLPPSRHKEGTSRTFVIDGHNLAYQASFAYAKLSYGGKSVSIIFGMAQILKSIIVQQKPGKVIICWDGNKHPKRMELLPTYKSHREEKRDPKQRKLFLKQIDRAQKMFYLMGIPQCYNEDIEGDDMIYMVVEREKLKAPVTIVSSDKDLRQLIDWEVSAYHPIKKIPYSLWAFSTNHAVEFWQYVDYLCLLGDDTDDIPGIRGIGPVKAAAFLRMFDSIKNYLSNEDLMFTGMNDRDKVRKIIKRNRRMIDLRLFHKKYNSQALITYIKDKRFPSFNEEKYIYFCRKWGLKTMMAESFMKVFKELQND